MTSFSKPYYDTTPLTAEDILDILNNIFHADQDDIALVVSMLREEEVV